MRTHVMGGCMERAVFYDQEVASSSDRTCAMNVYTSDPRLPVVEQTELTVTGDFTPGPSSDDVIVLGMPGQYAPTDDQGNFLYDAGAAPEAADAVHCAGVVARVVGMYRRALQRIGRPSALLRWQWGGAPLRVWPRAGERPTAGYFRETADIRFSYTRNPADKDDLLYMCRSFDLVAHMAGHAVLDGLKPAFYGDHVTDEVKAMHEAFADLTAIFCLFSHLPTCQKLAERCGDDFTNLPAYIPEVPSEDARDAFGGHEFGLRGIQLGVKVTDVVAEHMDWSRAFSSAIYEILLRMCETETRRGGGDTLHLAAQHVTGLVLGAYVEAPLFGASFRELAKYMLKTEPDARVRGIIKEEFTKRKFFDKNELPKRWHGVNKLGGCTTMVSRVTRF